MGETRQERLREALKTLDALGVRTTHRDVIDGQRSKPVQLPDEASTAFSRGRYELGKAHSGPARIRWAGSIKQNTGPTRCLDWMGPTLLVQGKRTSPALLKGTGPRVACPPNPSGWISPLSLSGGKKRIISPRRLLLYSDDDGQLASGRRPWTLSSGETAPPRATSTFGRMT